MHTQIHTHRRVYIYKIIHIYIEHLETHVLRTVLHSITYLCFALAIEGFACPNGLSGHVFVDMIGSPAEGATKPSVHVERAMSGQLRCCY